MLRLKLWLSIWDKPPSMRRFDILLKNRVFFGIKTDKASLSLDDMRGRAFWSKNIFRFLMPIEQKSSPKGCVFGWAEIIWIITTMIII